MNLFLLLCYVLSIILSKNANFYVKNLLNFSSILNFDKRALFYQKTEEY
jgi:hypothetical protein